MNGKIRVCREAAYPFEKWTMIGGDRTGAYPERFLSKVQGRKFRHPQTGNQVRFVSLPPEEQTKVYRQWMSMEPTPEEQSAIEQWEARQDVSGLGHDDVRQLYAKDGTPMREISDWTFTKEAELDKEAFRQKFLQWAAHQQFRHPVTGNRVKFISLPAQEQTRIYQSWQQREQPSPPGEPSPLKGLPPDHPLTRGRGLLREQTEQFLREKGTRGFHELPRGRQMEVFKDWLRGQEPRPQSREEFEDIPEQVASPDAEQCWGCFITANPREARMEDYAFAPLPFLPVGPTPGTLRSPTTPNVPGGFDEEPPEPPPPAEIRRMMSERMRDMGRALMISGVKQPRQQMIEIGRILNGLFDQLDALADQPGRNALRRRMLLTLRPRVMNPSR